MRLLLATVLAGVLAAGVASCGEEAGSSAETVPHAHNGLPAGDGTQASYVGYSLEDPTFPTRSGVPGTFSFRIDYAEGGPETAAPVTDYVTDLTQDMHVYVVSSDLEVYRHVHPTMAPDGTWSGSITVPRDGRYRMIAEFIAKDRGGNGDQVVLGVERSVGRAVPAVPVPGVTDSTTADGVTLDVVSTPVVGYDRRMTLAISRDGAPAALGTYLGVYAHVSAFNIATGELVHMHPLGTPETVDGRSDLTVHTGFRNPGEYRMFVQTRISGVVRTIPITVAVTA